MPADYIAKCVTCDEWKHKSAIVDGVCRDCREAAMAASMIDDEYLFYLGQTLRGKRPKIAPGGKYSKIYTPRGILKIRDTKY